MSTKIAIQHLIETLGGFIAGVGSELLAIKLYMVLDPQKESNFILFGVLILLLFFIYLFIAYVGQKTKDPTYVRYGMLTSQMFFISHSIDRIYKPVAEKLTDTMNFVPLS